MAIKAFEPLANITLSSAAVTVTFSGINQNYSDLIVVSETTLANSQNGLLSMQFNNVTSFSYANTRLIANGASVSALDSSSTTYVQLSTEYNYVMSETQIMGYAKNTKKPILVKTNGGSSVIEIYANDFLNSSPITSLRIFSDGATFAAGSTFALYGVI